MREFKIFLMLIILFYVNRSILSDDTNLFDLDLNGKIYKNSTLIDSTTKESSKRRVLIRIRNFTGINLNNLPLIKLISNKNQSVDMELSSCAFEFYSSQGVKLKDNEFNWNGNLLYTLFGKQVNASNIQMYAKNFTAPFSFDINSIEIKNAKLMHKMAPIVFKDLQVQLFSTYGGYALNEVKNYLRFAFVLVEEDFYSVKSYLMYDSYGIFMDELLLNPHLFKRITFLAYNGMLKGIDSGVFRHFDQLRILSLNLTNWRQFWHTNGLKWMQSIDTKYKAMDVKEIQNLLTAPTQRQQQIKARHFFRLAIEDSSPIAYDYPSEDYCLFLDWPFKRLIFPLFCAANGQYKRQIQVHSCLLQSLTKYTQLTNILANISVELKQSNSLQSCSQMAMLCRPNIKLGINLNANFFAVTNFFIPLICLMGLISSVMLIRILLHQLVSRQTTTTTEHHHYVYILFACVSNILIFLISPLLLLSQCLGTSMGYCSAFYDHWLIINLRIYLVGYACEALKRASLLATLFMCLDRLIMLNGSKLALARLFNSIHCSLKLLLALIYGFSISLFIIYEFDDPSSHHPSSSSSQIRLVQLPKMNLFELLMERNTQSKWFVYIYLTSYILNDLVIQLLIICIQVPMMRAVNVRLIESAESMKNSELDKQQQADMDLDIQSVASESSSSSPDSDPDPAPKIVSISSVMLFVILNFICLRLPELLVHASYAFINLELNFHLTLGPYLMNMANGLYLCSMAFEIHYFKATSPDLKQVIIENQKNQKKKKKNEESKDSINMKELQLANGEGDKKNHF